MLDLLSNPLRSRTYIQPETGDWPMDRFNTFEKIDRNRRRFLVLRL
jgi:hypothetical protein